MTPPHTAPEERAATVAPPARANGSPDASPPGRPRRRIGVGRKVLFALVPALALLLLAEGGLRVGGYRSTTADPYESFVLHRPLFEREGEVYRTRAERTRFFHPQTFPAAKRAGTRRYFVFGGSVTYGWGLPSPAKETYAHVLRNLLQQGGRGEFEDLNAGAPCYASYRLVGLVEECVQYEPDFIVIMSGHNEFLEPRYYADLMAKQGGGAGRLWHSLRLVQLVQDVGYRLRGADEGPGRKAGEAFLVGEEFEGTQYVVRDQAEFRHTIEHYERNLRRMLAAAEARGIPVIVCTVPSNLRDCPPNHTEPTGTMSLQEMQRKGQDVQALLERREWAQVLAAVDGVLAIEPRAAAFHYWRGVALDRMGRYDEARKHYLLAKDLDGFPHRAISPFNDIVRTLAAEGNAHLFDAEKLFESSARDGLPGNDLFIDNCHPSAQGHRLLAEGLRDVVVRAGLGR